MPQLVNREGFMSDMRDTFGNPLPLIALLLVAAGLIAQTVPLASVRPQEPERLKPPPSLGVPSRLWQDPLAAVEAYEEARKPGSDGSRPVPEIESLAAEVQDRLATATRQADTGPGARKLEAGEWLVLPVMLTASPFPDDAEIRRRIRYAVESGLAAQGFAPEDAETIRYVSWKPTRANCTAGAATLTPPTVGGECNSRSSLPFEWFSRTGGRDGQPLAAGAPSVALVLWLREHEFGQSPMARVERLVQGLLPPGAPAPRVSVVGPATSTQYLDLLRELDAREHAPVAREGPPVQFLSYGATIAEEEAALSALGRHEGNARPPESVVRVIKGDDLLIDALVRELGRRGVDRDGFTATGPKARCRETIALVVEGDYEYGRSLGRAFARRAAERCEHPHVRVFTYFRGLDGVLPVSGEREPRASPQRSDAKGKDGGSLEGPLENAEGRNQYDYLRRIGDQILQLDAEGGSERPLRAVGIFGSDVYDKLLVLQALAPRLPSAVFFTTDLDARFLHRDQQRWARNLVVASHFGLALHGRLQDGTAPFRDGYQTAAYLATLAATHPDPDAALRRVAKVESPPRLFEIGRTRPVDLGASSDARRCPDLLRCESFHPAPALELPRFASWRVWLAAGLGLLLVLLTTRANRFAADVVHIADRPPETRWPVVRNLVGWSAGAIAVALTLAMVAVFVREEIEAGEGEPFVWLEGVSAWPSHLLRFLALVVAVVLGAIAMRRLRVRGQRIADEFQLPALDAAEARRRWATRTGEDPSAPHARWQRRIEWLRGPFVDFARTEREASGDADRRVVVDRLWLRYLARTSGTPFWLWIALATALLGAFAAALYALDPPFFSHRGVWVARVNDLLWVANVVVLWGTIFWTVFEARACAYFIDRLSSTPSAWPAATLAKESERTGVPRACLVAQLDFRLVLAAAERVGPIVYVPFVQIFLLGVAFHPFFDTSDVPWTLITLAAISLAYALYAMVRLRGSAERARRQILAHYDSMLLWLQGSGTGAEPEGYAKEAPQGQRPTYTPLRLEEIEAGRRAAASGQVKALMASIGAERDGPFLPLLQQPAVKALLIPFGGWSGLSLVEPVLNYFGL
jgi:hypothetical protein